MALILLVSPQNFKNNPTNFYVVSCVEKTSLPRQSLKESVPDGHGFIVLKISPAPGIYSHKRVSNHAWNPATRFFKDQVKRVCS